MRPPRFHCLINPRFSIPKIERSPTQGGPANVFIVSGVEHDIENMQTTVTLDFAKGAGLHVGDPVAVNGDVFAVRYE